jgi:hypothetical protein
VGELELARGIEDAGGAQRVGADGRVLHAEPGEGRDVPERTTAEDRKRRGEPAGRRVQARDPERERAGDGLGPERRHQVGGVIVGICALGRERADEGVQEEWIAARSGVARSAEALGRLGAELAANDACRRKPAESARADGIAAGGREVRHQLVVRRRLAGADGDEDERGQAVEALDEMAEEAQRRAVGPVAVVDGEHERRFRGEVRRQPVEAVQDRVRDILAGDPVRGVVGPERPRGEPCGSFEQALPALVSPFDANGLEQLSDNAVGEVALERCTVRRERRQLALASERDRRLDERRLADSGRALDDEEAPTSVGGL